MTDEEIAKQAQDEAAAYLSDNHINSTIHAGAIRKLEEPSAYEHDLSEAAPGAVVGALLGYGASGAKFSPTNPNYATISKSRFTPMVERAMRVPQGTVNTLAAAQAPSNVPTVAQTRQILNGTIDPETGTTGRQRLGFNTETERQAALARQGMSNADELASRGLVDAKGNPFYKSPTVPTQGGVLVTPATSDALAAEKAAADTQLAKRAMTAKTVSGGLGTIGKVLPFAGAGLQAMDAYNRYKAGDTSGAVISALTAAASIPAPALATAIGMPIQWVHDNPDQAHAMYGQAKTTLKNPLSYQYPSDAMQ